MPLLALVDTSDQLPGLLPPHAWRALTEAHVVVLRDHDHPFLPHLELADVPVAVVPAEPGRASMSRADLLSGLSLEDKARAGWVVDRCREEGRVAYLFGPADSDAFTRTLGMEAARAEVEVEVVYFGHAPKGLRFVELVAVQDRLLGPGGCPWDAEQTHASLARYAVEEVHELVDAIAAEDLDGIREELGDVLMQVTFHAALAEREAAFDVDAVAGDIAAKLVRRHPHVFGDATAETAAAVEASWEELKSAEKPTREGPFEGVPASLPALALADKVLARAARAGVDVSSAGEPDASDVGGRLLALVLQARQAHTDPDQALRAAVARFRARVEALLEKAAADGVEPQSLSWSALPDHPGIAATDG